MEVNDYSECVKELNEVDNEIKQIQVININRTNKNKLKRTQFEQINNKNKENKNTAHERRNPQKFPWTL